MNAVTILFAVLVIVCLVGFGLAVKTMMSSVFRPLGGKIRMTSSLFFGMFTVLVSGVMAVVSLGVVFPVLGLVANALIAAFLCSASTALQVTRAFAKKPAAAEAEAAEPSAETAEPQDASTADAAEATSAAPVMGAAAATAAMAAPVAASEVDPRDTWAEQQATPAIQPVVSKPPYHGARLETMEDRHEPAFDIDDAVASYQPEAPAPVASVQAPAEVVSVQVPDLVDTAEALVRMDAVDRAETHADVDTFNVSQNGSSFSNVGQQDSSLQPA